MTLKKRKNAANTRIGNFGRGHFERSVSRKDCIEKYTGFWNASCVLVLSTCEIGNEDAEKDEKATRKRAMRGGGGRGVRL